MDTYPYYIEHGKMASRFWQLPYPPRSGGGARRDEWRFADDMGSYADRDKEDGRPAHSVHDSVLSSEQQKVLSTLTDIELYGEELGPVASPKPWRGASPPGNLQGFCQVLPHQLLLSEPCAPPSRSYAAGFTQQPTDIRLYRENISERTEYPGSGAMPVPLGSRLPGESAEFDDSGRELPYGSPSLRMHPRPATCYPGCETAGRMTPGSPVNSETCVFSDLPYADHTVAYEASGSAVPCSIDDSELQSCRGPGYRDSYQEEEGHCTAPSYGAGRRETHLLTGAFRSTAREDQSVTTRQTVWSGEENLHRDDYVHERPPTDGSLDSERAYPYVRGFPNGGRGQTQLTREMPDRHLGTVNFETPLKASQCSKAVFTHASDTGPPFSFCSAFAWTSEIAFARGDPIQLARYGEFAYIALEVRERADPVLPIFQDEEHEYCKACRGLVVHWPSHFESDNHRRAMGLPPLQKQPAIPPKVQKQGATYSVATWTRESPAGPPISYFSAQAWPFQVQGARGQDNALFRGRTLDDLGCNDPQLIICDEERSRYCRRCSGLLVCPPFHTCPRNPWDTAVPASYTGVASDRHFGSLLHSRPVESLRPEYEIQEEQPIRGDYASSEDGGVSPPEASYPVPVPVDCDDRYSYEEDHGGDPVIPRPSSDYLLERIQELKSAEGQLEMRARQLRLGMEITAKPKVTPQKNSKSVFMHATGTGPPVVFCSGVRWKDQIKLARGDEEVLKVECVKNYVNIVLEVRERGDPTLPIAPEEEQKYCQGCRGLVVHQATHEKSDVHRKALGLPPLKSPPPTRNKFIKRGPPVSRATWTRECKDGPPIAFCSKSRWRLQPKGVRGQTLPPVFARRTLDDMGKNDCVVAVANEKKGRYCDLCSGLLVHPPSHSCPVQKSKWLPQLSGSAVESPRLPGLGSDFLSAAARAPAFPGVPFEHEGTSGLAPDGSRRTFPYRGFQEQALSGDPGSSFESSCGYDDLNQGGYSPPQTEVTQNVEILSLHIEELKRKEQELGFQAEALQKQFQRPKQIHKQSKALFTHASSTGPPVSYCTGAKWRVQTRPFRGATKEYCKEFFMVVLDIREKGDPVLPVTTEEVNNYCRDCGGLVIHRATHKKSDKHRAALGLTPLPKPIGRPLQKPVLQKHVQKTSKATWTRESLEGPPVAYVNGSRWAMQAKGIRGKTDLYSLFRGRTLDDLGRDDPVLTAEDDANEYCEACCGLLVHRESHTCPKAQPRPKAKRALLPSPVPTHSLPGALQLAPTSPPFPSSTNPLFALPPQLDSGMNEGLYLSQSVPYVPTVSDKLPREVGSPCSLVDDYSLRIRELEQSERQLEMEARQLETARQQAQLGKRKYPSSFYGMPGPGKKFHRDASAVLPVQKKQGAHKAVFTNASETGPPVSFCSAHRWSSQCRVLREGNKCPSYLERVTMTLREAGDPVLPITEEEKQKYCRDCGCLLVHKRTHFKGDFHRSKKGQPLLPKKKQPPLSKRAKAYQKQVQGKRISVSVWTRESKDGPPFSFASRSKWGSQRKGLRVLRKNVFQYPLFKGNTLDDIGKDDPLLEVSEDESNSFCTICTGLLVHPPSHNCPGYPVLQRNAEDKE